MKTSETLTCICGEIETTFDDADLTHPMMLLPDVDAADTLVDGPLPPPPPFGVIVHSVAPVGDEALAS